MQFLLTHIYIIFKFMKNFINNKIILITGATGSFGSELVTILKSNFKPKKIIIFSRDELKQFEMANKLGDDKRLRFFIGDVRDRDRLNLAMKDVDYVFHAAALKHVPIAEYNPIEAIKTNIIGAENVIMSAIQNNVKKVIALSTDKAVNPINLYGATKLAADKLFIAANNLSAKNGTIFSVVRYGNVLGSRGSVVPFFLKIKEKKDKIIPITHKDMTRFFISINDAVNYVLNCTIKMKGGEIFVPKIPSFRIIDLAKALVPNCKLKFIGIRSGEKIDEVMISKEESKYTIETKNGYIVFPKIVINNIKTLKINSKTQKFVKDNFEYSSSNNNLFLDTKKTKAMCKRYKFI